MSFSRKSSATILDPVEQQQKLMTQLKENGNIIMDSDIYAVIDGAMVPVRAFSPKEGMYLAQLESRQLVRVKPSQLVRLKPAPPCEPARKDPSVYAYLKTW